MTTAERIPPPWLLSIPMAIFGMTAGFIIVTLPEMLAALGVPGGHIAVDVAIILSPGFWVFLLAPLLDIRFRRRTYAIVFGLLAVSATAFIVLDHVSETEIVAVMIVGYLSLALYGSAVGGWMGALIDKDQDSRLGAWTTIFNVSSGGLGVLLSGYFTQNFTPVPAAVLVFTVFLAPMLVFFWIPAPPPSPVLAKESFLRFAREILLLFKRSEVLVALVLFLLPAASFALTNALGGWGRDFHASPVLVSFFGGVGAILAGICGSFLVPPIAKRLPLRPLYLAVGIVGAGFTLTLLLLPRTPATYGLAFLGENLFQAAAFATAYAIIYQVIGKGNPLAATTFALLTSALNFPIVYMEVADGHGFDWHGVAGAFTVDALVSGGMCVLLWVVLFHVLRVQDRAPTAPALAETE